MAATLAALRRYAGSITAVASVADDGGSSGRLREAFGIAAPGDLRKCLVALARDEGVWTRAFEHRFEAGELEGHALGNLVIAGLVATTGDLVAALREAGELVGAVGTVLPATTGPVVLKAVAESGEVEGQVAVASAGRISCVGIVPPDAEATPEAVRAIAEADQIVLGPGSLFTSVLAAVAVRGIREALESATAPKVYVCNLRQQHSETSGFDVASHVDALVAHGVTPDVVVHDPAALEVGPLSVRAVSAALTAPGQLGHDPARLAAVLAELVG